MVPTGTAMSTVRIPATSCPSRSVVGTSTRYEPPRVGGQHGLPAALRSERGAEAERIHEWINDAIFYAVVHAGLFVIGVKLLYDASGGL